MGKLINDNSDLLKDSSYVVEDLRNRRNKECFTIINRGALWYDTLTTSQKQELNKWYQDWLNVTETLTAPTKPAWLI